jgi:hypothetical protein
MLLDSLMRESGHIVGEYSREMALLRASVRSCLADTDYSSSAVASLCEGVNWTYVLWIGTQQHALLFLDAALLRAPDGSCPEEIRAQLDTLRAPNLLKTMARGRELCRLRDELARRKITAIAAGGPAFAQRYYAQPALRQVGAQSFYYFHPADRIPAEMTLRELGYKLPTSPLDLASTERSQIHFRTELGTGDAKAGIWMDAEPFSFGGRTLLLPSPVGWLLHLCWLGARRLWADFQCVYDVGILLRKNPTLDWVEIWTRATRLRLEDAVLLGLALSHEVLELKLPDPIARELSRRPAIARTVAALARPFFIGPTAAPRLRTALQTRLVLQPGIVKKLRCVWEHARVALKFPSRGKADPEESLTPYGLYSPTPLPIVEAMLRAAGVGANDLVCDLGCGDGRVVILAAEKFGARGLGIDSDPRRIAEARSAAAKRGVAERVTFVEADLLRTDIRDATVVCAYLQDFIYEKIRRKIDREAPHARVVSHDFIFPNWPPDKSEIIRSSPLQTSQIYVWRTKTVSVQLPIPLRARKA